LQVPYTHQATLQLQESVDAGKRGVGRVQAVDDPAEVRAQVQLHLIVQRGGQPVQRGHIDLDRRVVGQPGRGTVTAALIATHSPTGYRPGHPRITPCG
jgi:hypothetical protein